jgi:hypothetical protein
VAGCCEHDNEPSDSIEGREVFEKMSYSQILKKDSVPLS